MSVNLTYGIKFQASGSSQVAGEVKATDAALNKLEGTAQRVSAAEQKQQQETKKLTQELDNLRSSISPTYAAQQRLAQGTDVLNRSLAAGVINARDHKRSIDDLGRSTSASSGYVRGLASSLALVLSLSSIATKLDEYTKFTAQLRLATETQNEFTESYENTIRIARTAQGEIASVGVLYARTNNSLRQLGATQNQIASITETVALSLKVSGATAAESSGAILQLSQAFGSGVLRGEEFNAVNEAAPALMRALAASIGVPVSALRGMAEQGLLTADVVANAFKSPTLLAALREQAKEVRTISSGYTSLKNELTISLGEFDRATGISRTLASTLSLLANNANVLIPIIGGLAVALLAISAPAIITGLGLIVTAVAAIGLPVLAIIGGLTAVAIAYAKFSQDSRTELQKLIDKEYELGRVRQEVGRKTGGTIEAEANQKAYREAQAEVSRRVKELRELQKTIRFSAFTRGDQGAPDLLSKEAELNQKLNIAISQQNSLRRISAEGRAKDNDLVIKNSATYSALALEIGVTSEKLKVYTAQEEKLIGLLNTGKITQEQYGEAIAKINKNRQQFLDGQNKLSASQKQSAKEESDAIKQAERDSAAYTKARLKYSDDLYKANQTTLDGINQSIAATRAEIDNFGKLPSEITAVTIAKLELAKADALLFKNSIAVDGINAQIEAFKNLRAIQVEAEAATNSRENLERLEKQYQDSQKARVSAAQKADDEQKRNFEKTVDGIDQVFRLGFAGMLNRGENSWKAWGKSLLTSFKTTVADSIYRLLAQPFVIKLVASILGVAGSSAAGAASSLIASEGGAAGVGGIFETIKGGLNSLNTNVVGSIEKLGVLISNGNGGLADTIGGALGQYSNQIATGLAFLPAAISLLKGDVKSAAFQGAGAGIGFAITGGNPIGAAIGSFLGGAVGGLFGKKKAPRFDSSVNGIYQNGQFTATQGATDYKRLGADAQLGGLGNAFSASLDALLSGFGIEGTAINTSNRLVQKRKASYGLFEASFGGATVSAGVQGSAKTTQKTYEELVAKVLGETLAGAIQKSKLSEGIRSLFAGFTDRTQVANLITATLNLNAAQDQLQSRFGLTVDAAGKVSKASGLAGEDLIKFVNDLTATSLAYKKQSQVILEARKNLETGIFEATGQALPDSLAAFDNILKGIDKSNAAGIAQFSELFSARTDFSNFTTAMDQLKNGVNAAVFELKSPADQLLELKSNLAASFAELKIPVPGSLQALIDLSKSIPYDTEAGLDLALALPTLAAAMKNVQDRSDALVSSLSAVSEDSFTTLVDFAEYKRLASVYGIDYANDYNKSKGLRSFATGTNLVPFDMTANIHKDERIIPAADNRELLDRLNESSQIGNVVTELLNLRSDLRAGQEKLILHTSDVYDVLKKFDLVGLPPEREATT